MQYSLDQVAIVEKPNIPLAVWEHRGPPAALGASIQQFIQWRKQNGLHPSRHATFNLIYDDPDSVLPEHYRFDLAVQVSAPINEMPLVNKTIPQGRYAKIRHVGNDDHLATSITFLLTEWLSQSGEKKADFPLVLHRVTLFAEDVEAITDIYLALQ